MMKYVFWIAVVVAAVMAGWQILDPEVTNIIFQDELHDMAAQLAWRTGMSAPSSEEELRNLVIRKAEKHDLALDPQQVVVKRSGSGENSVLYIAVHYTVPVNLRVFSFTMRFNPTSTGGRF